MFGFNIDDSLTEAERILAAAASCSLDCWRTVARTYRRAKAPFIAALDAQTGRRTYPYTHDLTDANRSSAWGAALRGGALSVAQEAEYAARNRLARSDDEHRASAADAVERAVAHAVRMERAAASLRMFASLGYPTDGVVPGRAQDAYAAWSALSPEIRAGQRVGRALATYLRQCGQTPDDASRIVDAVTQCAQCAPRTGEIVLSANPLDLLFCSESCSYSSCHALDGCHCAGPQQYLADSHTIVAYYWERAEYWERLDLPHKLYRQMIYLDRSRQCAALQRRYGQSLPAGAHLAIRRAVAQLLARLSGAPDEDPRWYHSAEEKRAVVEYDGEQLAYLDPTVEYVSLARGKRPHISLPDAPCAGCGSHLDKADQLVCSECADAERCECSACGHRLSEDDCCHDDDGNSYCADCYHERYSLCVHCGRELCMDDAERIDDIGHVCERCLERRYARCQHCEEHVPTDDTSTVEGNIWCDTCAESDAHECVECAELYETDHLDTTPYHVEHRDYGDNDLLCLDCRDAARLDVLYARLCRALEDAPLFGDTFTPARRVAIRLMWANVHEVSLSAFTAAPVAVE